MPSIQSSTQQSDSRPTAGGVLPNATTRAAAAAPTTAFEPSPDPASNETLPFLALVAIVAGAALCMVLLFCAGNKTQNQKKIFFNPDPCQSCAAGRNAKNPATPIWQPC